MPKKPVPIVQKNVRIPLDVAEALALRAQETGESENSIFVKALRRYLGLANGENGEEE